MSNCYWRVITKDNIASLYGASSKSRIFDPDNPGRAFSWLFSQVFDDKSNLIQNNYKLESSEGVDGNLAPELGRGTPGLGGEALNSCQIL